MTALARALGPLLLLVVLACAAQAADYTAPSYAGGPSYADVLSGKYKPSVSPYSGQPQPQGPAPAPGPAPGPAAHAPGHHAHHPAPAAARPEHAVSEAVTHFSLDVAKDVLARVPGNAVVSPIGVANLLSLLHQGADRLSDTSAQLEDRLYLDRETSRLGVPRLLQNAVTKRNAKSVLENANTLFVNEQWTLKKPFLQLAQYDYGMNVSSLDFKQPEAAVAAINKWASDATHSRIPSLVSPGAVTPRTSLVLASAMYFRGVWKYMFDASKNVQKTFSTSPSRNATVFMMQQLGDFRVGELPDLEAQWLELPFDGDHFSLVLVLPDRRHGLGELLQRLTPRHVAAMLTDSPARRTLITLPRFTLSTDASLGRTLKTLGMKALFARDAKLRGVSDNALSVSDVIHKAEMKVDEQGATASAASAVLVNTLSLISFTEDMKFFADHPFLALIVDRNSKVPLFIGRVAEPIEGF
ncbi:leukocyte elastase inhibitor-like [Thrips palmi]|uniref:Leukocyte elastase inhibitor-like n=1 Tax=Thrips palmi TaxID=161013 RepID=A0A6P8ZTH3_THRPL|nr:leukocyte elastase inhibitor-like [Thrips palmi]